MSEPRTDRQRELALSPKETPGLGRYIRASACCKTNDALPAATAGGARPADRLSRPEGKREQWLILTRDGVAFQGGGMHAAFAVGALTEILNDYREKWFELVGLSGTSAGALCALMAWYGLTPMRTSFGSATCGSVSDAIRNLNQFWEDFVARTPAVLKKTNSSWDSRPSPHCGRSVSTSGECAQLDRGALWRELSPAGAEARPYAVSGHCDGPAPSGMLVRAGTMGCLDLREGNGST